MTLYASTRASHPPFTWYANGAEVPAEAAAELNIKEVADSVYATLERGGPTTYHPTTWAECKEHLVEKQGPVGDRLALIMTLSVEGPGEVTIVNPRLGVDIKLAPTGNFIMLPAADVPPYAFSAEAEANPTPPDASDIIGKPVSVQKENPLAKAFILVCYWAKD